MYQCTVCNFLNSRVLELLISCLRGQVESLVDSLSALDNDQCIVALIESVLTDLQALAVQVSWQVEFLVVKEEGALLESSFDTS